MIKKAALNLAKAYANIKAITGDDLEMEIKVNQLSADRVFWRMLDENVDKVEEFYRSQLNNFTEKFHILTLQAIRLVCNLPTHLDLRLATFDLFAIYLFCKMYRVLLKSMFLLHGG